MKLNKVLYGGLSCVCILFILYALAKNYIIDPEAEHFLSLKTDLRRELNMNVHYG